MKKYLIPTITILLVLAVTWTAFGQPQERGRQRGNRQNVSAEERAKMRERFQNMSTEEREKLRARMSERGGPGRGGFMNPEAQDQAIKAIEEQLAKLKAAKITRPEGGIQDLTQEERAKLREKMMSTMQNRQKALQTIIAQVAALQGRRQAPAGGGQGGQFMIINTGDLRPIQAAAKKEEAKETTQLLERLIARGAGRGFGGRGQGAGQRPEGAQRGPRPQRPEGGRQRQGGQGAGRQQRNR
ncbi:MAG: hypothetical protein GY845_04125 [Planctomycetes bacterium]|nr:hypothetical protein [Planctomycetota bacterium]